MHKKYKIKKRKKLINPYYAFSILAICLFFLSYSYAFFNDYLNIHGKATILENITPQIEYGNSTFIWEETSNWNNNINYTYALELSLTNLDEDYSSWELTFEIPQNTNLTNTSIWSSSDTQITGNQITIKSYAWNGPVAYGNTLKLQMQLSFDAPTTDFNSMKVIYNGKYARYVNSTNPNTNTSSNTITNNTSNTNTSSNTITNNTSNTNTSSNTITNNTSNTNTSTNTVTNNTSNTNTSTNTITNNTTNTTEPDPIVPSTVGTYSWSQTGNWGNSGNQTYMVSIPINYTGDSISSWTISFDVPDGFIVEASYFWQASSATLSGNTVTLISQSWNGSLPKNGSLTLSTQLTFNQQVNMNITNLKINGKDVNYQP